MPRRTVLDAAQAGAAAYRYQGMQPRGYERGLWSALSPDIRDGKLVGPQYDESFLDWHRGSGKTGGIIGLVVVPWMCLKPAAYVHILPTAVQARKVVWDDPIFQNLFPNFGPDTKAVNHTEMVIRIQVPPWVIDTPNGKVKIHDGGLSRYYLAGADDRDAIDRIRGTSPFGRVVDEAGWTDLMAILRVMGPRLLINRGWLSILTTPPEVYNEAVHKEWLRMQGDPRCFTSTVKATETFMDAPGESGERLVTDEMIARYRERHGNAATEREFFGSWDAANVSGSIYGDWMKEARDQGRIGQFPHLPDQPVGVMADIGSDNLTALLFYQHEGSRIRFFDYHASQGSSPDKLVATMMAKPYRYGRLTLPHDAGQRHFVAGGLSVDAQVRPKLNCEVRVGTKVDIKWTGVYRVREMFPRFCFNEAVLGRKPADGLPSFLESMEKYAEKTDVSGRGTGQIIHEFSDGPDALRTGIQEWREGMSVWDEVRQPVRVVTDFDVFEKAGDRDSRRRVLEFNAFGRAA